MVKTLRDRCGEALGKIKKIERESDQGVLNNAHIRRWDAMLDYLTDFVHSEAGRKGDPKLDQTAPLVLYFGNEQDRADFIKAAEAELPNGRWKEMP